jgi:hypothetical protein
MAEGDRRGEPPSRHRGIVEGPSRSRGIVEIRLGEAYDRGRGLRSRILELVRAGVPRRHGDARGEGWWHRPGALPWSETRQRVGGRVKAAEFTAAVEDLMAEGNLIEVWLRMAGRRAPSHVLLLPDHPEALRHPVARARGLAEVLEEEPWYEPGPGR